jgi:hypothetical protein
MVRFSNKLGHYRFHLTFSQLVFLDVISRPKRDLYPFGDFSVYHYERVCAGTIHGRKTTMHQIPTSSPSSPTRRAVMGGASALAFGYPIGSTAAQEATPPADPIGVDSSLLGAGVPTSAPGMELSLLRTTIAPGGVLPPHIHPGPFVIAVDAGTWGYTPQKGSVKLTRAAAGGSPTPAEEATLDGELILTKGDFLFIEDASQDWMRNAGDDEVVLLIAGLVPVGQDFGTLLDETNTGTPTT